MRVATLVLVLCGTATPVLAQDVSAVTEASQKFSAAIGGPDISAAAAMFADDAFVLPPGRPALSGKPQVQRFLTNFSRNVQDLHYTSESIAPLGEGGAREIGTVSFKTQPHNGKTPQDVTGKYLILWVKAGSEWKISADMWNRSGGPGGQGGPGGGQKRKPMGGNAAQEVDPGTE